MFLGLLLLYIFFKCQVSSFFLTIKGFVMLNISIFLNKINNLLLFGVKNIYT